MGWVCHKKGKSGHRHTEGDGGRGGGTWPQPRGAWVTRAEEVGRTLSQSLGGSIAPRPLLREHVSVLFLLCLPLVCGTLLQKPQEKATHPLKIFVFLKKKTDELNKAEKLYPRVLNLSYTVT